MRRWPAALTLAGLLLLAGCSTGYQGPTAAGPDGSGPPPMTIVNAPSVESLAAVGGEVRES